jgi:hypothetical protein
MPAQKLTLFILFVLGAAGLITIGVSFLEQIACEGQLVNVNFHPSDEQQIWADQVIGQSFVAPYNGLNRLDLLLQTYGRKNTQGVILRLLEIPAGIREPFQGIERVRLLFNADEVNDQSWKSFTFPAISDSAKKTFLIILQSPTSKPGDAITVGGIDKDIYRPGTAFLGLRSLPIDIAFRACFQMGIVEKLQILSEQMTRYRPALWGNFNFYLSGLIVYTLLLVGLFWQLVKLPL